MGDSISVERIAHYADHRVLSDDLRECLRSIFPREYLVGLVHGDFHVTGRTWFPPLDIGSRRVSGSLWPCHALLPCAAPPMTRKCSHIQKTANDKEFGFASAAGKRAIRPRATWEYRRTECRGRGKRILKLLLHNLQRYPDRLEHSKRLVSLGFGNDTPDEMGLTPVQLAGWEGLPDAVEYWLSLGPNLEHVNGFGGNLLSTIVHGSENCPDRENRDHVSCARLALNAGVPLPRLMPRYAGDESMAGFLAERAASHPQQIVEEGVY